MKVRGQQKSRILVLGREGRVQAKARDVLEESVQTLFLAVVFYFCTGKNETEMNLQKIPQTFFDKSQRVESVCTQETGFR